MPHPPTFLWTDKGKKPGARMLRGGLGSARAAAAGRSAAPRGSSTTKNSAWRSVCGSRGRIWAGNGRDTRAFSSEAALEPKLQRGDGCQALAVGQTYHNFTLERVAKVPEYNIDALELRHARTGARYLHIDAQDANNVFRCVGFHAFQGVYLLMWS